MSVEILTGDCRTTLATLPAGSVQTCVTSPPYWSQRDYGHGDQLGQEDAPEAFIGALVDVFREVRRVLADDGTLWVNIADTYSAGGNGGGGSWGAKRDEKEWRGIANRTGFRAAPDGYKRKELLCIPWLFARAMSVDGWYLRRDIVWSKQTANEPPREDRPSGSHEFVFLFAKSATYYFEHHERSRLSVWHIPTQPYSGAHFATMPPALAERCILAGSRPGDTVLDPFGGAGTTGLVADRLRRDAVLCELNPEYAKLARERIVADAGLFADVEVAA